MSLRLRIAWAGALIVALVASAAWIGLGDRGAEAPTTTEPQDVDARGLHARAFDAARRSVRQHERDRARAEHAGEERGPSQATLRLYADTLGEAELVARRFHAAFARYEFGEADLAALRATATGALARELLSSPPRPLGAAPLERALLGRLELVPGEGSGTRLTVVELVGTVRRGQRRDPIAFEMRRREGRWLVAGLGL